MMDMSHYDECRTLMLKYKTSHIRRLVFLCICMIANFYFHVTMFGFKYSGTALTAVYAEQSEEMRSKGFDAITAMMLGILAIAGAFALVIIGFKMQNKKIKGLLIGAGLVLLFIVRFTGNQYQSTHVENNGVRVSHLAFGMGVMALLFSIAAIVLAFLGEQIRPKVFIALLVVLILGMVADMFDISIGILLLFIYAFEIPEIRKMQWIRQQPGYPYFNERFDEQQAHSQYEPLHRLDHRSYAEMVDINETFPDAPQYHKDKEREHRAEQKRVNTLQMGYTMKQSDDPAEMPGIEDIFEQPQPEPEPLPEPELPNVDDIPMPVWNTPDPVMDSDSLGSGFPETTWDIPDTNWDIPQI